MKPVPRALFFLGAMLAVLLTSPAAQAHGPVLVACIRDLSEDPGKIHGLFGWIDRMATKELEDASVAFHLVDKGSVSAADLVQQLNFRDGREDSAPLRVTGIRKLAFGNEPANRMSYVVGTVRLAWFDRGSALHSSYSNLSDTWLISFYGCGIDTVRETPELSYLIED